MVSSKVSCVCEFTPVDMTSLEYAVTSRTDQPSESTCLDRELNPFHDVAWFQSIMRIITFYRNIICCASSPLKSDSSCSICSCSKLSCMSSTKIPRSTECPVLDCTYTNICTIAVMAYSTYVKNQIYCISTCNSFEEIVFYLNGLIL